MSEKIANRYAAALLSLTQGQETLRDHVAEGLREIARLFENKELKKVLSSPVVDVGLLRQVFDNAAKQIKAEPILRNFLGLLIESHRSSCIPAIAKAFHKKLLQTRGIVEATVTTAIPLQDSELQGVQTRLESMLGKKVRLDTQLDKTILGGFVVHVQNSLLDMSLKSKLDQMTKIAVS